MEPYIYAAREGVHIFDLAKTKEGLEKAGEFLKAVAGKEGVVLWVGTKRQAQGFIKETAVSLGHPYICQRWIGGLLTNFGQVKKSVDRLRDLKEKKASGELTKYTKKENLLIDREIARLEKLFGGLASLTKLPDVLVVVDTHREKTAVSEARRVGIPVVGLIDTNSDPTMVSYGIPANDDAVKSIEFVIGYLSSAIAEGKGHPVKDKEMEKVEKVEEKAEEDGEEKTKKRGRPVKKDLPKEEKTA